MEARKRGETTQYVTDEDAGKRKAARNRDGQRTTSRTQGAASAYTRDTAAKRQGEQQREEVEEPV